jgi:hypothetical protein
MPSNPKTRTDKNMKTKVILYRKNKAWELGSYSGGPIPSTPPFATATAAKAFASMRGWVVKRAENCDE